MANQDIFQSFSEFREFATLAIIQTPETYIVAKRPTPNFSLQKKSIPKCQKKQLNKASPQVLWSYSEKYNYIKNEEEKLVAKTQSSTGR